MGFKFSLIWETLGCDAAPRGNIDARGFSAYLEPGSLCFSRPRARLHAAALAAKLVFRGPASVFCACKILRLLLNADGWGERLLDDALNYNDRRDPTSTDGFLAEEASRRRVEHNGKYGVRKEDYFKMGFSKLFDQKYKYSAFFTVGKF